MMKLKTNTLTFLTFVLICLLFLTYSPFARAQGSNSPVLKSDFWEKVQFGGGLGLGFSNNYTNIMVAPSAIYRVNPYFATGLGAQYSYIKQKNFYHSHLYGGSIIGLVNPIQAVQLSAELEQLRVNNTYTQFTSNVTDDFWNTALFLGAGYRMQNVTIGIRYNVLYQKSENVYGEAWMPFVRAYF